jgi:hypothetical protein
VASAAASRLASIGLAYSKALPGLIMDVPTTEPTIEPVEADIWKIEGNTVYFFNQLRGLQVLDLSDPSAPQLMASLRLPAVGQDLYVLPGSGEERTVVLLTQVSSAESGQSTRIHVVKVAGGKASLTATREVAGSLADSRLVKNRLILATTEVSGSSMKSHLSEWLLSANSAPEAAGETLIEGGNPLISSGSDWLSVTVNPQGEWGASAVSVFAIRSTGLIPMASSIRTEGLVTNKFRIQWSGNVLTTISESRGDQSDRRPRTVIENFRAWSPGVIHPQVVEGRLGRLELTEARGESLYATRFAGDKAYIVTFLQTDPLWVVDLSDPANPVVAGHLEVPGWSSYLQPFGDLLFSIGMESGRVAASLFDVADPANPTLLRRLNLGDYGSFSEAIWSEKALKVIPGAGLAMIPLTSYDWASGQSKSVVQLLDVDLAARDLRLRGEIQHAFDARRADLIGEAVVSISQRVMQVADVSNRDTPAMLSEVALAWPVERVVEAAGHLFQIEDGQAFGNSRATVRVSLANDPEAVLSETDLGEGVVKSAEYRDGKLYVIRQVGSGSPWLFWVRFMGPQGNPVNQLILSIYDASLAPTLTLLGSCSVTPKSGGQLADRGLFWPQPNRPALAMDYQFSFWSGYGFNPLPVVDPPVMMLAETSSRVSNSKGWAGFAAMGLSKRSPIVSVQPVLPPLWIPENPPELILFDVSQATAPVVDATVNLGPAGSMLNGACDAADGLVVAGITQWRDPQTGQWLDSTQAYQSVSVIKIPTTGTPVVRPSIDLPGELFAITELDAKGFLAFTRKTDSKGSKTLQVSACDGFDAFLIASLPEAADAATAVSGRRVAAASPDGVTRRLLGDTGVFVVEAPLQLGWQPSSLRWVQGVLTGMKSDSVFAVEATGTTATVWNFPTWSFQLNRVALAADGDLLIPFGEYGAERLDR